jgi:hypothetical protein
MLTFSKRGAALGVNVMMVRTGLLQIRSVQNRLQVHFQSRRRVTDVCEPTLDEHSPAFWQMATEEERQGSKYTGGGGGGGATGGTNSAGLTLPGLRAAAAIATS